ncbi:MAG: hypothetical protein KDC87_14595 [Planctomycetes bacterium]|nr:hypothetical protein [Planctomycetota bacterium]
MPHRTRNPRALCSLALAASIVAPWVPAQRTDAPIGVFRPEPGLLHPLIRAQIEGYGRPLNGLVFPFHPSVPAKAKLRPGAECVRRDKPFRKEWGFTTAGKVR